MTRRPNLNQTATQQARAEYQPQIRGVRRSTRSQVRSIRSEGPALEASLGRSAEQLRHAGLSPKDLAIALSELAHRTADVGASTALQTQQVQQEGHGQIVDLLSAEGQAQRSALSSLQNAQAEHAQDLADEERSDTRQFKLDLLKAEAEKGLHLGSYADQGHGGLTPTQQRAAQADHQNAAHFAKEYVHAAREGLVDEKTNEQILPPGPHNWNDQQWGIFVDKVSKVAGVDIPVAEKAVQAVRDHFQPDGGGAASLLHKLGAVASVAAPAVAPSALQPIAQFGSALLRH